MLSKQFISQYKSLNKKRLLTKSVRGVMMVKEITKEEFESKVLRNSKHAIVDLWASWCGPCRMLAPVLEELEGELKEADFFKLDTEKYADIASQLGVMSIPTLIIFKGGSEIGRISGFKPKPQLKEELQKIMA